MMHHYLNVDYTHSDEEKKRKEILSPQKGHVESHLFLFICLPLYVISSIENTKSSTEN